MTHSELFSYCRIDSRTRATISGAQAIERPAWYTPEETCSSYVSNPPHGAHPEGNVTICSVI
jgi:hypothetical protein